jgi:diguanylate cyclase (GGDEF)-like protein
MCIENAIKFRVVESSATADALTGLPNARALYLHLNGEVARGERSNSGFTLLVCDVDGLRTVNEQFGQRAGNALLKRFAEGLTTACREYDYVARVSGDEFVAVLPGLKPGAIKEKSERFRLLAESTAQAVCGSPVVTLSIGHAVYPEHGSDAETLLQHAERMVYAAQRERTAKASPVNEPDMVSPSEFRSAIPQPTR